MVDMAGGSLESSMRPSSGKRELPGPISLLLLARMSLHASLLLSIDLRKDLNTLVVASWLS